MNINVKTASAIDKAINVTCEYLVAGDTTTPSDTTKPEEDKPADESKGHVFTTNENFAIPVSDYQGNEMLTVTLENGDDSVKGNSANGCIGYAAKDGSWKKIKWDFGGSKDPITVKLDLADVADNGLIEVQLWYYKEGPVNMTYTVGASDGSSSTGVADEPASGGNQGGDSANKPQGGDSFRFTSTDQTTKTIPPSSWEIKETLKVLFENVNERVKGNYTNGSVTYTDKDGKTVSEKWDFGGKNNDIELSIDLANVKPGTDISVECLYFKEGTRHDVKVTYGYEEGGAATTPGTGDENQGSTSSTPTFEETIHLMRRTPSM